MINRGVKITYLMKNAFGRRMEMVTYARNERELNELCLSIKRDGGVIIEII